VAAVEGPPVGVARAAADVHDVGRIFHIHDLDVALREDSMS
jgi:hypothetical protein